MCQLVSLIGCIRISLDNNWMLKDSVPESNDGGVNLSAPHGGQLLRAVLARMKEIVCRKPRATVPNIREELALAIFLWRQARETVVTAAVEEALKEEVMLQCLRVFRHVASRNVHIR